MSLITLIHQIDDESKIIFDKVYLFPIIQIFLKI
jgi:hypothetical protein